MTVSVDDVQAMVLQGLCRAHAFGGWFLWCVLAVLAWRMVRWARTKHVSVAGKAIVITGCDHGFGRMTAVALDKLGARVFALCLTDAGARSLAQDCSSRLTAVVGNVCSDRDVEVLAAVVAEACPGGLYGLVNNAGVIGGFIIEATPMAEFQRIMDVNYFGMVRVTKALIPHMFRGSQIVNIASIAGRISVGGMSAYASSKHACEGFSDALRREMAPWGIRVAVVEPTFMRTQMVTGATERLQREWGQVAEGVREKYGEDWFADVIATMVNDVDKHTYPPEKVVNRIVANLQTDTPPHHAIVGFEAATLFRLISLLPTEVSDPILRLVGASHTPAKAANF